MDWSPIASSALSLAGSLFGLGESRDSAHSAMEQQFQNNLELMRNQQNWNVGNYQHRYQWSVNDLRAAGLNPVLAATQGIGGNVQGASALSNSAVSAQTPDFGSILGSTVNSAIANKTARETALKGLELQERSTAVQEMEAKTRAFEAETNRMNVESEISSRTQRIDLEKAAQKFDQELRSAWQDFAMENQNRLTELKAQETAASIRHMAAQDANLETMAQVALRDVSVKEVLANVAEENGISHRALEAAQAVCSNRQADFYEKYGHTQEAQEELARAQTALTNYKRSVAGIETVSDVMKGILSVAVAGKIGMDMIPTGSGRVGF